MNNFEGTIRVFLSPFIRRWYLLSVFCPRDAHVRSNTQQRKTSREQDSSGDKLVTRSSVLYETKKVCLGHCVRGFLCIFESPAVVKREYQALM